MKNLSRLLVLTLGLLISGSIAMAETTQFTPLNFSDNTTIKTTNNSNLGTTPEVKGTDLLDPTQVKGGTKMQNSILQMDNAQIEIRNQLLNYKANYTEIDARYNTTKAERKTAKKQIKNAEKKIKNLDKAKKQIRKNFQRNMNI